MRTDNIEHKALFTIPEPSYSNIVALRKPLPLQRKITGHKQTDAYLWVLEVIRLNEPAHLQAAEDALEKLTITPKEAQKRYSEHLMKSGAHAFQVALGTMSMDNPAGAIKAARAAIEQASKVRAIFGSYDAAMDNVPAEDLMLVGKVGEAYSVYWGWTEQEIAEECVQGQRCTDIDEQRKDISKGFVSQLPAPTTLSDVVREFQYWEWLYRMRNTAEKEMGYQYADGGRSHISDREDYLEPLLSTIKPVSRQEAIEVSKWVLDGHRFMDRGELTEAIILNLVGECEA